MALAVDFIRQNPDLVCVLLAYVAWNIARRPPPQHPVLRVVWQVCELLTILPWDRWVGGLKLPGTIQPPPPPPLTKDPPP